MSSIAFCETPPMVVSAPDIVDIAPDAAIMGINPPVGWIRAAFTSGGKAPKSTFGRSNMSVLVDHPKYVELWPTTIAPD
ncbi:hypothetical protein ACWIGW_39180 [Nocardia brasiliensis]